MTSKPSREQFAAAYKNQNLTVEDIALQFRVSKTTVKDWAKRFDLSARRSGGYRAGSQAPRIVLKAEENHCEPVHDGPGPDDPTPEQIAELAAYCMARNVIAMQTLEDLHCEHRQTGRCWKCRRWKT